MRKLDLAMLLAGGVIAVPVLVATVSAAPAPAPAPAAAPTPPEPVMPPSLPATYVADLMTAPVAAAFGAQWRTMEAKIVETKPIEGHLPEYNSAYDISPHAGGMNFDDSKWPKIEAKDLAARRSGGHVAFIWYRTNLTIPAKIGDFDTTGAKAVLTVLVDDYAEIWVNGDIPRKSGYPSPATIQGLNMPNRVVLADSVKPGDKFQIAVFGINGPISVAPANTVWFREARLEFYK
jgi:gluconolactonase